MLSVRLFAVSASLGAPAVLGRFARLFRFGLPLSSGFLFHLLSGLGSLWFASHRPHAGSPSQHTS